MSLPGSRRARPERRQPSRTQRSHTPRASNSPALNRPEPLKRPPTTTAVIWLIGMLTLLTGVVLRIAGNKPLGGGDTPARCRDSDPRPTRQPQRTMSSRNTKPNAR